MIYIRAWILYWFLGKSGSVAWKWTNAMSRPVYVSRTLVPSNIGTRKINDNTYDLTSNCKFSKTLTKTAASRRSYDRTWTSTTATKTHSIQIHFMLHTHIALPHSFILIDTSGDFLAIFFEILSTFTETWSS